MTVYDGPPNLLVSVVQELVLKTDIVSFVLAALLISKGNVLDKFKISKTEVSNSILPVRKPAL
jgi:hypothetical protein